MKRTWKVLLVIICSMLLALVFTHFLHRPSNKIIGQWKQSESVNYKSFDPYAEMNASAKKTTLETFRTQSPIKKVSSVAFIISGTLV